MNTKVCDLMITQVITLQPHHTVDRLRHLIDTNHVHAVPVIDSEGTAVGIVSSADLVPDLKGGTSISQIMTQKVYTIPQYDDVHIAARIMRNHRIHHVVVTHEQKVVGMLSSFDLLKLVEDHRFVMKNPPPESTHKGRVPIFPARFLSDRNVKRPSVSTCSTGLLCSMNVTEEWPLHFLDTKRYSPL